MIFVAERVAGRDILDADDRRDVTRINRVDILALVRLDLDQTADAVPLVGARIVDRVALGQLAAVNAEEDQLTDERIAPEFESQTNRTSRCHPRPRIGPAVSGSCPLAGRYRSAREDNR